MISVCLCDPHPIIHEGLKAALERCEDMRFVGSGQSLPESRAQLDRERPNVVVVDRSFGMHPILEWIGESRQQLPETEIVVWATSISDVECFRALQAGARGILRKTASVPALFHCLRTVARKELWTENLFITKDQQLGRPRNRPLTPREQQVAALVAKGMKNREIAETLGIATGTVKIHLMHIFEKTDIRDRFELALQGLRLATMRPGEPEEAAAEGTLTPVARWSPVDAD